jgi:rubrerythrin
MGKKFARNIEDFTCYNCGFEVNGNGYTDHCPKCLYGLHVDIKPGDRECKCHGKMEPVSSISDRYGTFTISYVCLKCGMKKKVKASPDDSVEALEAFSSKR